MMDDSHLPGEDAQKIWWHLGEHSAAIQAQRERSTQLEADTKSSFAVVHTRFNEITTHLGTQDLRAASDKAEILEAQKRIENAILVQSTRKNLVKWIISGIVTLGLAGLGAAANYFGLGGHG